MGAYNLNIPLIQKDELLFSYVRRVAIYNALTELTFCSLFDMPHFNQQSFISNLNEIFTLLGIKESPINMFEDHTEMKLHRFVMKKEEIETYEKCIKDNLSSNTMFLNHFNENLICPVCALEDIEKYGHPIKRIYQNYYNVYACADHKCKLIVFDDFKSKIDDITLSKTEEANIDDIEYATWIKKLFESNIHNACFENTEKLCVNELNVEDYEVLAENSNDEMYLYNVAKYKSMDKLNHIQVHRVIYLLFKDYFNSFKEEYNNIANKD